MDLRSVVESKARAARQAATALALCPARVKDEALAQMEDDKVPAGRVGRMLQKGYRLRDRLLRPARVMVSKGPARSSEGEGSE